MMGVFAVDVVRRRVALRAARAEDRRRCGRRCARRRHVRAVVVGKDSTYVSLVPGMVVLGAGVGLFYSSITTAGGDRARSFPVESRRRRSCTCAQIAGGAVGLGLNTAIVTQSADLTDGISTAFLVDRLLAFAGSSSWCCSSAARWTRRTSRARSTAIGRTADPLRRAKRRKAWEHRQRNCPQSGTGH